MTAEQGPEGKSAPRGGAAYQRDSALVALTALVFLAVGAGVVWKLLGGRSRYPETLPLPGGEVTVRLTRGGVFVEGDAVDPIRTTDLSRGGAPLPVSLLWKWKDQGRELHFCDLGNSTDPIQARVRTAFRDVTCDLSPARRRAGVVLRVLSLPGERMEGFPAARLAFNSDGHWLAVGAEMGELKATPLLHEDRKAGPVTLRKAGAGGAPAAVFGPKGEAIVVAPDAGVLYARPLSDAKERWRLPLGEDLGLPAGAASACSYELFTLAGGDLLCAARNVNPARARFWRVDSATGRARWRFPAEGPLETPVEGLAVAANGSRLALLLRAATGGTGTAPSIPADYELAVVALDSGRETGRLRLPGSAAVRAAPPLAPVLALAPGGAVAVAGSSDGRMWAADCETARLLWESAPGAEVAGLPPCPVLAAAATDETLYAVFDRPWRKPSAGGEAAGVETHPASDSIQAFASRGADGKPIWRYDLPGRPGGLWLSPDGRWLAYPLEYPPKSGPRGERQPARYALAMLDLTLPGPGAEKQAYELPVDGPLSRLAVWSPDGKYLAVIQGPGAGDEPSAPRFRVLVAH